MKLMPQRGWVRALVFCAGGIFMAAIGATFAGVSPNISQLVAIGDPTTPSQQLAINPDGSINTKGEAGAGLPSCEANSVNVTGAAAGVMGSAVSTAGCGAVEIHVVSNSATSIEFFTSHDLGVSYQPVICNSEYNITIPANTVAAVNAIYLCPAGDHFELQQVGAGATSAWITPKVLVPPTSNTVAQGNIASGAADSGDPNKIAGVYTTSPSAVTNGQRVNQWDDQFGNIGESPYGGGMVPETASAVGTTAATTATLASAAGKTTYLCGFSIRANATAAATGNATVTGTITGTLNFTQWTAPLASGIGITEPPITKCIPASGVATSIAVVSAAPGSGGTVSVTAWGFEE